MLRHDGYVKILDFGLAKLTEPEGAQPEDLTRSMNQTGTGMVMGTLHYMSPEQSRGEEVDARTDIFSLGVVLYEMVTGQLPFEGKDVHRWIIAIQEQQPCSLSSLTEGVPERLEEIVAKTLAKEPGARYQTARDLLIDLRNLTKKIEINAELERSFTPDERAVAATEGKAQTIGRNEAGAETVGAARSTSSAEYIVSGLKHHKSRAMVALAAIILLAITGVIYYFYFARGGQTPPIDSIVVLPFVNMSNDPNTDYLADGISEALTNSLTELRQLRVIARSTAFRYKGREIDPQAIGRELNVRAVLMGRIRQIGDTLDTQVDLVDARTGAQLWGEEYERKVSDVILVKQTIAREVTEKLRLRLSGEEQQRLIRRDTTNVEAYQFYLRGRYLWNKRTADGLKKAIEQFQQAIDRDPNYALGYVGLADCYMMLEEYTGTPASETFPKARFAADRALQIDDSLSEAHTSSAAIYHNMWHWAEGEAEYRRAINLNPNYPTTHQWLGVYFEIRGQFDDALRESKRAQELDPLSPIISSYVARAYLLKNDSTSAVEQCLRVLELDSSFPPAHDTLGFAYLKDGRYEEAGAEFQKAVEFSGRAGRYLGDLGYCYAVTAKRDEALAILKELKERYARRAALGQHLAGVYAGLGDRDQAFAWLEKDFQQLSGELTQITWRFNFDSLRSDPRYVDLMRRVGLNS
jgi:serine/threonine-protein kinase